MPGLKEGFTYRCFPSLIPVASVVKAEVCPSVTLADMFLNLLHGVGIFA